MKRKRFYVVAFFNWRVTAWPRSVRFCHTSPGIRGEGVHTPTSLHLTPTLHLSVIPEHAAESARKCQVTAGTGSNSEHQPKSGASPAAQLRRTPRTSRSPKPRAQTGARARSGVRAAALAARSRLSVLWPRGLQPARLLCPWDSPGKKTGAACHARARGALPDPGMEPRSPAFRADSLSQSRLGSPGLDLGYTKGCVR